ncbi:Hsp70 family protein [Cupriavidus sp. 2TAF22]|uniref:Hsp70 family protein n=1 Tax=unclassified Cupriavidus TaxID=2640874 RepID=UPI003F9374A5
MDHDKHTIIGIDLGTTNSLVAVWRDGRAQIIPNSLGKRLTPSCVSVLDDGAVVVGEAARDRLLTHPAHSAALFKRYMGTARATPLGERRYRPEELSSFLLRALKADAEAWLGAPVSEAVITVPAYFSDAQRRATRVAGELAGLRVERLLNEPTAAALAYGLQQNGESRFLVFDLGGGTFDVSVLELFENVMEVRASAGDNFLGGEDFVAALMRRFSRDSGLDARLSAGGVQEGEAQPERWPAQLRERVRHAAEGAKRALSDAAGADMAVTWEDRTFTMSLTQEVFAELSTPLLERLRKPIEQAMRDARIRPAELDSVVLAGGATRMPMVRRLVSRMFGRFPVTELNPDEVVALGAAVQAGLKARDAALDEVVMTDVAPYSLGIETSQRVGPEAFSHGHYQPVIDRNSVVPVSRVERIHPLADKQEMLALRVFQGEGRMVAENVFLGEIAVPLPRISAAESGVDVRFTYDVNGILEVQATVLATAATHRIVIQENPGVLSDEEVGERLAALAEIKIHPRDQAENAQLVARADRLYQQCLGRDRDQISGALAQFQAALDAQDTERIRTLRAPIRRLLDGLDTQLWD